MARPIVYPESLILKLPAGTKDSLRKIAEEQQRTVSEVLREVILKAIKKEK